MKKKNARTECSFVIIFAKSLGYVKGHGHVFGQKENQNIMFTMAYKICKYVLNLVTSISKAMGDKLNARN